MKKFAIKVAILGLTTIILFYVLELAIRKVPNNYSYKVSFLEQNSENIEILILGNSHIYRGIIADSLSLSSFNAGYISQSLDIDFKIFEKYKNNLINLKYLVFNVSYPSLFTSLSGGIEDWRLKNYEIYYGLNFSESKFRNKFEILSNKSIHNRGYLFDYYIRGYSQLTCTERGSEPLDSSKDLEDTAVKAAQRHTLVNSPYYLSYIEGLEDIIRFCSYLDIEVIALTPPVTEIYRSKLNRLQLSLMEEALNSLNSKYQNVHVYNLLSDSTFDKGCFLDGDHLNQEGAILLTEILDREITFLEKEKSQ